MTEAELQAEVILSIQARGLLWHHCGRSTYCHGTPGLPDLIIAGRYGIRLAELKSDDGQTSAEQDRWLYTIGQRVWRPRDLELGTIGAALDDLTRPQRPRPILL